VVSDLMRVAREIRSGSPERVSPFAHAHLGEYDPVSVTLHESAYYLRFRVKDRPGIIAQLATALAQENISIDAVLQLPNVNWRDLPFVFTVEPATEKAIRAAIARMNEMQFFIEPPLAMPMERPL
jgi:homoserine dehydrogenase